MRPLVWKAGPNRQPLRVLAVGAHADDIEIGCGGTLLSWIRSGEPVDVTWVVLAAAGAREVEARSSAEFFMTGAVQSRIVSHKFRDGYFPYDAGIKDVFEQLKAEVEPDVVFTHCRDDRHQDHRVVSDLTWNTFRSHVILEYEIPKFDGDSGSPNVFVPLPVEICDAKVDGLLTHFRSQLRKRWFTRETFLGLARLRGIETGDSTGYAEAFYARKLLIEPLGPPGTAVTLDESARPSRRTSPLSERRGPHRRRVVGR